MPRDNTNSEVEEITEACAEVLAKGMARAELWNRPDFDVSASSKVVDGRDRPGWYYRLSAEAWAESYRERAPAVAAGLKAAKRKPKDAPARLVYVGIDATGAEHRCSLHKHRSDKPGVREAVARQHLQLVHQCTLVAGEVVSETGERVADPAIAPLAKVMVAPRVVDEVRESVAPAPAMAAPKRRERKRRAVPMPVQSAVLAEIPSPRATIRVVVAAARRAPRSAWQSFAM